MTIGFERFNYSVGENDTIEVCVVLNFGTVDESAEVDVISSDLTATGKICYSHYFHHSLYSGKAIYSSCQIKFSVSFVLCFAILTQFISFILILP